MLIQSVLIAVFLITYTQILPILTWAMKIIIKIINIFKSRNTKNTTNHKEVANETLLIDLNSLTVYHLLNSIVTILVYNN